MRASSLSVGLMAAVVAFSAIAQQATPPPAEENPVVHPPSDPTSRFGDTPRMIVKFRSASPSGVAQIQSSASGEAASSAAASKFAARAGARVLETRALMAGMSTLRIEPRAGESFAEQLARVRADPDVEFAVPDERRFPHALPSDPLFTGQWYLQSAQPSAINAQAAWDTSVGTAGVVIAVIDTGVLYGHPDLKRANVGGRLLPGYDFITQAAIANDGNGRDSDPTDAGDWVTSAESNASNGPFTNCGASNSSWHGTRVSGIIGALSNNSLGVTGITWNPWILPARALGKCGGFDSDIIDAMAWAAGRHLNGIPDNPYPAKIENLSLGSTEACPASYASVVADLATTGVLVVASAGNEGGPVDAPANCPGVAAITGLRHAGTKVGFASLGTEVALGAPGGNCVNTGVGQPCLFSIDTTTNDGTTTANNFTYTDQFNINVGTSFSSPIVSGIAGLMASVNGNLNAAQLLARLKEGATTPFPVSADPTVPMCHVPANAQDVQAAECSCTTSTCGAGMANAVGALNAALRPIAAVVRPASVVGGQPVALSGAGSAGACNRTITTYLLDEIEWHGLVDEHKHGCDKFGRGAHLGLRHRFATHRDRRCWQAGHGGCHDQHADYKFRCAGECRKQRVPCRDRSASACQRHRRARDCDPADGHRHADLHRNRHEHAERRRDVGCQRRRRRQFDGRHHLGRRCVLGAAERADAGDRDGQGHVGRRPVALGIRAGDH